MKYPERPEMTTRIGAIDARTSGAVLENLHTEDYRSAVITIDRLLNTFTIRQLYDKIRPIVESNRNFGVARKVYEGIYS